jgi:tRNA (guanine-N7-)-methyltransferase
MTSETNTSGTPPSDANERVERRTIRSFVLRGGRLTEGQKRALDTLWPDFGIDPGDDVLDLAALFGRTAPLVMEIGFGNGEATWRMAEASPEEDFIAVEVHQPGVGQLLMNLQRNGITNTRVYCGDAVEFLKTRIPNDSLSAVRLFFPDPWPKKRHHKRRIIQQEFCRLVASRMKRGAIFHLATDWQPYAEHMLEVVKDCGRFENLSATGDYCPRPDWRPETKYERRGQRLGHPVHDLMFRVQVNSGRPR